MKLKVLELIENVCMCVREKDNRERDGEAWMNTNDRARLTSWQLVKLSGIV